MNSTEPCPDSHYRCPGDFNDCLPVYTRCNGMHDCIDGQDEDGCEDRTCAGFFRCRAATVCVHSDHLCDGWPHCPLHDDELGCEEVCPYGCRCLGHSFRCPQPFTAATFRQLRSLDATGSGMTVSDVNSNTYLIRLVLSQCSLAFLPEIKLLNLRMLDLSDNKLQQVNLTSFLGAENLRELSLSNNPIISLHSDIVYSKKQYALLTVDLSYTTLTVFYAKILSLFPHIRKLNLTFTSIHTITSGGFNFIPQLTELHMIGSPVTNIPPHIFRGLSTLRFISSENHRLCCKDMLPSNHEDLSCHAPADEVSSCEDLLLSWTYRGFLWLVTILSLTGNVFCLCARLLARGMTFSSGFNVFVTNLTIADFLMGVYMAIIGVTDERYRGRYLYHDDAWKSSVTCKLAGFLSLLSSEVSALIIWIITLDRFLALRFPFSSLRFSRRSAALACLLIWGIGWFLACFPLLPVASHWEFYSQTGICIPLPVTRNDFTGKLYAFSILIIFNFVLFIFISAGQAFIYWSVQNNALKTNSTKVSRDITIARRLISVAVTDFTCWFPIGLCGILAMAGTPIPGEVNVALAIFVLPLNSALNPFLYTFNRLSEKLRHANEAKLLKWLESRPDLMVN
ncbi:hypothetical protein ACOMHN_032295 [Nucella lapillus]